MKYNRMLLLSVLFLTAFTLGGCMGVKDMTEEESDMVAEFSAGVLLRYSDTYQWRLITKEQRQAAGETSSPAPEATVTPSEGPQATVNPAEGGVSGDGSTETPAIQEVSLDDVYRLNGVNVSFSDAWTCKKYKNIQVRADSDERLLVVAFQLRNTSSKKRSVNLMKRNIEYPLEIDGATYQLGLNLLEGNDMKYLKLSLAPGEKKKAVLVYNIPKSAAKRGMRATVNVREAGSDKQATYNITIK